MEIITTIKVSRKELVSALQRVGYKIPNNAIIYLDDLDSDGYNVRNHLRDKYPIVVVFTTEEAAGPLFEQGGIESRTGPGVPYIEKLDT